MDDLEKLTQKIGVIAGKLDALERAMDAQIARSAAQQSLAQSRYDLLRRECGAILRDLERMADDPRDNATHA